MYYFCTYFDSNYLARALALYNSLSRNCGTFHLFALCMDADSYESLKKLQLPNVTAVALEEVEAANQELLGVKAHRSLLEYYYTCGPVWLSYVLERYKFVGLVTYLDSDLFF